MSTAPVPSAPVPSAPEPLFQPHRPAFWLYCLLLAGGAYTAGMVAFRGFIVMPHAALLGALAWALYTLPLLLLFRWLGVFRGQPATPFWLAFAWGGLGAVYLAVPANQAIFGIAAKLGSPAFSHAWGAAIAGPTDEEPLKLLGVVLLLLIAPGRFRTISSIMALGALVGLGFQVVEDYFYTINGVFGHPTPNQFEPVLQNLIVRGVLCGIWSHAAYSAVAAFGVGYFVAHAEAPFARRVLVALASLGGAWAMHSFWNSPLLASLMGGAWFFLYLPIKGLPVLLSALLLWRVARKEAARTAAPQP
jgi:RsiW-degrading membrane proteinase PrsW (M82 family)